MKNKLELSIRRRRTLIAVAALSVTATAADMSRAQLVTSTFVGTSYSYDGLQDTFNYSGGTLPTSSNLLDISTYASGSLSIVDNTTESTSLTIGALVFDKALSSQTYVDSAAAYTTSKATTLTLSGQNQGTTLSNDGNVVPSGDLITLTSKVGTTYAVDIRGSNGGITLNLPASGGNFDVYTGETLELGGSATIGTSGTPSTGGINIDGGGTVDLFQPNGYQYFTGGFTVTGSTLSVATQMTSYALGSASTTTTLNGGTLSLAADYGKSLSSPISLTAGTANQIFSPNSANGSVTFQSTLSGGSSTTTLTKNGSGELFLDGSQSGTVSNTFAGQFTVNLGSVGFDSGLEFAGASTISIGASTLSYASYTGSTGDSTPSSVAYVLSSSTSTIDTSPVAAGAAFTIHGSVTGAGTLLKTGAGALILGVGLADTGGLTANGGTLIVDGPVSLGAVTVNAGAFVSLNGYGTSNSTSNFAGAVSVNGGTLLVSSGFNDLHGGSAITLNSGTLEYDGYGTVLSLNSTIGNSSFTLIGTNDIDVGTLTPGASVTLGITPVITGSGTASLTKTDVGTLALGANGISLTGTGGITVNGGALTVNGPAFTSNGGITVNSGYGSFSSAAPLSGGGGVTVNGGSLSLAGTNSYTGTTNVGGGSLTVSGPITANSGINVGTGSAYFNATIGGSGGVTVNSGGFVSLHGYASTFFTSNFTGAVNVNSGTLLISSALDLNGGGTVNLNAGTLEYDGRTPVTSYDTTINSATFTVSNQSDIDVGTLTAGNSVTLEIGATVTGTGGLLKTDIGTLILDAGSSAAGGLTTNGGGLIVGGPVSGAGGITVNGGFVKLTSTSSFTGGTTINGGVLQSLSTAYLGTSTAALPDALTLNGGTFSYTNTSASPAATTSTMPLYVGSGGGTITTSTSPLTFTGTVAPLGGLTTSGPLDVSAGTVVFSNTSVSGVPLAVGSAGSVAFQGSAPSVTSLTGSTGASVMLGLTTSGGSATALTIGSDNTNTVFAGQIADRSATSAGAIGSIIKTGSGQLVLSSAMGNTYKGGTSIYGGMLVAANISGSGTGSGPVTVGDGNSNAGTLGGNGIVSGNITINSNGALAPGTYGGPASYSTGTLSGGGNLTLHSGATVVEKLASQSTYDSTVLTNTGNLTFDTGTNTVTLLLVSVGGFQPQPTDPYTLLTFPSSETLTNFTPTTNNTGGTFVVSAGATGFYVGEADIQEVNNGATDSIVLTYATPEPGSATLLLMGTGGFILRRRRRSKQRM